jgi:hypothetical protein
MFGLNNQDVITNISDSYISGNNGGSSLMMMLYSSANIYNTTFVDNVASRLNNGITMITSTLIANRVTIN